MSSVLSIGRDRLIEIAYRNARFDDDDDNDDDLGIGGASEGDEFRNVSPRRLAASLKEVIYDLATPRCL